MRRAPGRPRAEKISFKKFHFFRGIFIFIFSFIFLGVYVFAGVLWFLGALSIARNHLKIRRIVILSND